MSARAEELLQTALARGVGNSPEEVIEQALQSIAMRAPLTEAEMEQRRKAIEGIREFRKKHALKLAPGETIKDLINEGRKY